ncbi:hypothetical protein [Micromonospora aurantiaca (nom. illeg.)]|uniref:hypothetical protein n=1 Tax=Micromonospora aurantiaca (nom. illeg.) TaxID=47850 RepID=UPI001656F4CC|nr:hypothetical protein [Micromonospora aurantiaca]MBC9006658.1 hypothetical protein [Micromonospora aurantiaca]
MLAHRWDAAGRRDGLRLRRLLSLIVAVVVTTIVAHGSLDLAVATSADSSPSSVALHMQPCPEDVPGHVTGACPAESPRAMPVTEPTNPTLTRLIVPPTADVTAPASSPPSHLRPRLAQLVVYRT